MIAVVLALAVVGEVVVVVVTVQPALPLDFAVHGRPEA